MREKTKVEGLFYFDGLKKVEVFTPSPIFEPCSCVNNEEEIEDDICRYCDGTQECLVESITPEHALDVFMSETSAEFRETVISLLNQKAFLQKRYGRHVPNNIYDYWVENADVKSLLRMIASYHCLVSSADRLAFSEKLASYPELLLRLSRSSCALVSK